MPPPDSSSAARRPSLRLIRGEGQRRDEPLTTRDAVVRVLIESGMDLLLRNLSTERAADIEARVDRIMNLFDRLDARPGLQAVLQAELDDLEAVMREHRIRRRAR